MRREGGGITEGKREVEEQDRILRMEECRMEE